VLLAFSSLKYFRGFLLFLYFGFIKVSIAMAIELQERRLCVIGSSVQSTQLLLMSGFQDFIIIEETLKTKSTCLCGQMLNTESAEGK
jgi:hypothetical protein